MTKRNGTGPIERVQQRLEAWRKSRKAGSRIPERLWNAAAELARSYGASKVAQRLSLDYYKLKERRDGIVAAGASTSQSATSFIELAPAAALQVAECVIEMENTEGARMRMHFKGEGLPKAENLCVEFFKNGR